VGWGWMRPCRAVGCLTANAIAASGSQHCWLCTSSSIQVLLLLKQGVHRLHLHDPSGTISVAKRSSVTTLKLSSLAARLAAVAVESATQRSDAPGGGGRGGVFVGDLSQRGDVDVEQLGGRLVTQLVLAARTQRGRQQLFTILTNPRWRPRHVGKISSRDISATGRPIHFMYCSRVGFSGPADLTVLFLIRINSRWRLPPSWIISNGHISATGQDLLI